MRWNVRVVFDWVNGQDVRLATGAALGAATRLVLGGVAAASAVGVTAVGLRLGAGFGGGGLKEERHQRCLYGKAFVPTIVNSRWVLN